MNSTVKGLVPCIKVKTVIDKVNSSRKTTFIKMGPREQNLFRALQRAGHFIRAWAGGVVITCLYLLIIFPQRKATSCVTVTGIQFYNLEQGSL